MELERWLSERILHRSKVPSTPALVELLMQVFQSARNGHLCLYLDSPVDLPSQLCGDGLGLEPLVLEENRLYLQRNWILEKEAFEKVAALRRKRPSDSIVISPEDIAHLQPEQARAVEEGAKQMFSILSGGPGTGKSYTAGCLIRVLAKSRKGPFKVAIAAPTGKAAAHLEEALRIQGPLPENLLLESTTLHRLLGVFSGMNKIPERMIDADFVVVDESSMLDLPLMLHLFRAVGPQTKLLLIGDPDQLPPVEAGSLFAEISELFSLKLTTSMRMKEGNLLRCANAINSGDFQKTMELLTQSPDLSLVEKDFRQSPADLANWMKDCLPSPIYDEEPDPVQCLNAQRRFRILSGLRQGPYGTDRFNQLIFEQYQRYRWLAIPIIISKNDPRSNLFNGTAGILVKKSGTRFGKAYFGGFEGYRELPEEALPQFEIGFCLSIHKSQGSEFDEVMVLLPPGCERFGREALYTAITRAKKKASLITDMATLKSSISQSGRKKSGFTKRYGAQ